MATSVTQSLFGMTPQALQAQRAAEMEKQAMQFARLSPMESARMGLFYGVNQLGDAIGQRLGYEDPEMAQAKARQGLLGGLDMSNPEALREAARNADPETSRMLINQALEVEKQLADVGAKAAQAQKAEADMLSQQQGYQFRFEALKKRFPNISDEEARAVANSETAFNNVFKDQQEKLSSFAQQLVDEGLKPGTPEFQSRMRQYNDRQTSKKSLEEALGTGLAGLAAAMAGPRAEKAAGAEGTEVGKATAQIGAGYRSLDALRAAIDTVDKGIYAGGYGPLAETVSKYSSGVLGGKDRLVNTEAFRSYIGNVVIPMMSQLGGSDSNEELRKMEEILGANTRLEPEAIKRILARAEEAVRKDLARIEKQQQAVEQGQRLPIGPIEPKNVPKPTKRFNRETGKFETIGG